MKRRQPRRAHSVGDLAIAEEVHVMAAIAQGGCESQYGRLVSGASVTHQRDDGVSPIGCSFHAGCLPALPWNALISARKKNFRALGSCHALLQERSDLQKSRARVIFEELRPAHVSPQRDQSLVA
jgi:hypothetical protein